MKKIIFAVFATVSILPSIGVAATCINKGDDTNFTFSTDGGLNAGESKAGQAYSKDSTGNFEDLGSIQVQIISSQLDPYNNIVATIKIISGKLKDKSVEIKCGTSNDPF